jgi:hypothetical protein
VPEHLLLHKVVLRAVDARMRVGLQAFANRQNAIREGSAEPPHALENLEAKLTLLPLHARSRTNTVTLRDE